MLEYVVFFLYSTHLHTMHTVYICLSSFEMFPKKDFSCWVHYYFCSETHVENVAIIYKIYIFSSFKTVRNIFCPTLQVAVGRIHFS